MPICLQTRDSKQVLITSKKALFDISTTMFDTKVAVIVVIMLIDHH